MWGKIKPLLPPESGFGGGRLALTAKSSRAFYGYLELGRLGEISL